MRPLFLATLAALVFLPTVASAQEGRPIEAWYHLRAGDEVQTVQATTIEMTHGKDMTKVLLDGKEMTLDGPIALSFAGAGPEPTPYNDDRGGSTSASGSGTRTEVEVIVDFDGKSTTRTTTTHTDDAGNTTTTTTTTTTTAGGETTTETTTTRN